jgi:hypothetical protein
MSDSIVPTTRLAFATGGLHDALEEANTIVGRLEKIFEEVGLPFVLRPPYRVDTDVSAAEVDEFDGADEWREWDRCWTLVIDRLDGAKVGLGIRRYLRRPEYEIHVQDTRPWAYCLPHEQLEAYRHLPSLLDELAARVDEVCDVTRDVTAELNELAASAE